MAGRVKDYLQEYDVKAVREEDKLIDVIKNMVENDIELCVVIGFTGHIVGILNEVMLMHWRNRPQVKDAVVRDVTRTSTVVTVNLMDHMSDVAEIFLQNHNVDSLVVTDNGKATGAIRKKDVLKWMLDEINKGN